MSFLRSVPGVTMEIDDRVRPVRVISMLFVLMFAMLASVPMVMANEGMSTGSRAPQSATVWGYVYDTNEVPIVGASVDGDVKDAPLLIPRHTTSQFGGYYSLEVPNGLIIIYCKKTGYFNTSVTSTLTQGEVRRLDFHLRIMPPIDSKIKGTITDKDTGAPIRATIYLYDFMHDFSTTTESPLLTGNYQLDIYAGKFMLQVYDNSENHLWQYRSGVVTVSGQSTIADFQLEKMPLFNSTINITVNYETSTKIGPVKYPNFWIVNRNAHITSNVKGDSAGNLNIKLFAGTFEIWTSSENMTDLQLDIRNVTVAANSTTNIMITLTELPPGVSTYDITLRTWNNGTNGISSYTYGRDEGGDTRTFRFIIDLLLGNGDGNATEDEMGEYTKLFIDQLKGSMDLQDTKDTAELDGSYYIFDIDTNSIDLNNTGSIYELSPSRLTMKANITTNAPINESAPNHTFDLVLTYKTPGTTPYVNITLPEGFGLASENSSDIIDITAIGNRLVITSDMDPDLTDSVINESVRMGLKDIVPPIAVMGHNITVDEDKELTISAFGSTDNLGIAGYSWEFGDGTGNNSTTSSVKHVYTQPGNYTLNMTVTDRAGLKDTDTTWVLVMDTTEPTPMMSLDGVVNGTVDEDVQVRLSAAGSSDNVGIVNWTWEISGTGLGQGQVDLFGADSMFTFVQPGTYMVRLIMIDAAANEANDTMEIDVIDVTKPVAIIDGSHTILEGAEVRLTAANSTDNVGVVDFLWDVGEGDTTFPGMVMTHRYSKPGNYTVNLTVKDAVGLSSTTSWWVVVKDVTRPVAKFTAPAKALVQRTQVFNATGSFDNVAIVYYSWDFGDGTFGEGQVSEHKYNTAGSYKVVLIVVDAENNEDRMELQIDITEPNNPFVTGFVLMILFGAVAMAGAGGLLLYWRYKRGGYRVDDILVIYRDGRLLHHTSRADDIEGDTDIVASMLTAVQDFVKDSLRATSPDKSSERSAFLGKLEYGKRKILVERGRDIFLAVVLTGYDPETLRTQMKDVVNIIGKKYRAILGEWDGDLEHVQGMSELTRPLMSKKGRVK